MLCTERVSVSLTFSVHLLQELKLPTFRAHSPLLKSRRFFVDILTLLSRHCHLCPSARHLAIYLLDHFMDQYNVTTSKQLYTKEGFQLLLKMQGLIHCIPLPPFFIVSR